MKNTIWIVALEPLDSRYTGHWYDYLPKQVLAYIKACGLDNRFQVLQITGEQRESEVTEGAFLNFNDTNIWKSSQAIEVAHLFNDGQVQDGDYFLYTDAWNPAAIQTRYMADLAGIKIRMGGIWHAGSYDKNDFLGRQFNKQWSFAFESSLFNLFDNNFFATDYHIDLFCRTLDTNPFMQKKIVRTGFPMEYYSELEDFNYTNNFKQDLIVFPHRLSEEKRLDVFKQLEKELPEYNFLVCQEQKLTKAEYHDILRSAKIVFSASKQETLGIGVYEGMLVDALPLVPNTLSYEEMYDDRFKYNEGEEPIPRIRSMMENHETYLDTLRANRDKVKFKYFTGMIMYQTILEEML